MTESGDYKSYAEISDPELRRIYFDEVHSRLGGLAGMNDREQDELRIAFGTRKERKEAKARKKAREAAKNRARQDQPPG